MRDFTLKTFEQLLQALKGQDYTFQTFRDFLKAPASKAIVLRHDVDARKLNSLQTARIEAELGITGTYYFRMVPQSFNPGVIRQIAELGHEIGYHYEDLTLAAKKAKKEGRSKKEDRRPKKDLAGSPRPARVWNRTKDLAESPRPTRVWNSKPEEKRNREEILYEIAIRLFEEHLTKLRHIVPIDTICMHGSPLSKYNNRRLWEKYNYRNYGIIGEPYLDVDFSKVLYLTDTGRRWDGERVSIRDKVVTPSYSEASAGKSDEGRVTSSVKSEEGVVKGQGEDKNKPSFHSTFNIITASKSGSFPAHIMITVHPQRWDNSILPWMKELIWQRVKNGVKGIIARKNISEIPT